MNQLVQMSDQRMFKKILRAVVNTKDASTYDKMVGRSERNRFRGYAEMARVVNIGEE